MRASGVGGDLTIVINTGAIMTGPTGGVPSPSHTCSLLEERGRIQEEEIYQISFLFLKEVGSLLTIGN